MVKYNKLYMCIYTCLEIPVPITQTTVAHTNAPFFLLDIGADYFETFPYIPFAKPTQKTRKTGL